MTGRVVASGFETRDTMCHFPSLPHFSVYELLTDCVPRLTVTVTVISSPTLLVPPQPVALPLPLAGSACDTAGAMVAVAKLHAAIRVMSVVRVLLSIS